jgi:hypothetical protein
LVCLHCVIPAIVTNSLAMHALKKKQSNIISLENNRLHLFGVLCMPKRLTFDYMCVTVVRLNYQLQCTNTVFVLALPLDRKFVLMYVRCLAPHNLIDFLGDLSLSLTIVPSLFPIGPCGLKFEYST